MMLINKMRAIIIKTRAMQNLQIANLSWKYQFY